MSKVCLPFGNHPERKADVEGPGNTDASEEQPGEQCQVVKNAQETIRGDRHQAVERIKIRRKRDLEIVRVGDDVPAVTRHLELADMAAHRPDPNGMGQFMAKHIESQRTRFAEDPQAAKKGESPEKRAQRKNPKLF